MADECNEIKKMQEAVANYLIGGGSITTVPMGLEALNKGGKKRKKARSRKAKIKRVAAPTAGELGRQEKTPGITYELESEDIVPDKPVDTGIAERPFAAIENYEDDQPRRRGFYKQHEISVGKGKQKPMVITTAVGEYIADSEPDEFLP